MSPPGRTVTGLLVPLNRWQEISSPTEGTFVEMFAPGCLRESFAERALSRIRGLVDHGKSLLFGRRPVMRLSRLWEEPAAGFYEGVLDADLPRSFVDKLRRGELGSSIGAKVLEADYTPRPGRSAWNPKGLEQRVYRRLEVRDISLTPRPAYAQATAVLRSVPEDVPGTIYRTSPAAVVVAPAWWLETPPRLVPDYVGGEEVFDYLAAPL